MKPQVFTILPFELKLGVTTFRGRVAIELDEPETPRPLRKRRRKPKAKRKK